MDKDLKKQINSQMNTTIEFLEKDFSTIRTGRASLSLLDGITVDSYGTQMPLNQVATLASPEPKMITIQPWDQNIISNIEKAILKSDLGLTPGNDGKIIRINVPPLTEERRLQLVKIVRKKAEEARISIRNIRREANDELKRLEKEEHISEDEIKRSQNDVQKITDSFIEKINEVLEHKEKEIMEV